MTANTIVALSTAPGGAIAVIRLSGDEAILICDRIFKGKMKLIETDSHSIHFGKIMNGTELIDEVLVSVFKNPHSYTGENSVEISCHGSNYIIQSIINLLLKNGAKLATAGEFTQRAFLNGKLDLAQAEAVADLIASESRASHAIAMNQMRGGVSSELASLREALINFTALIELELDFGEEDVEFANRQELSDLVQNLKSKIENLIQSFAYGNAIKNGVPVAIIGYPNAGKSSLLNVLLNEERAIVSDIAGTTRDTIEEILNIEGINFRFIDTAGLRDSDDIVENIGIERTKLAIEKAEIILHIYDIRDYDINKNAVSPYLEFIEQQSKKLIHVANKLDLHDKNEDLNIAISTKTKLGIEELKSKMVALLDKNKFENGVVISNARHLESLINAKESLKEVKLGMAQNLSGDLLAFHLRATLKHIGVITGNIDVDKDILGTIFGKFCIGK
jgi:tRNA modification GTPase